MFGSRLLIVLALACSEVSAFAPLRLSTQRLRPVASATLESISIKEQQQGVAIVTGGSRGLGAAISKQLGTCGCKVVVNYAGNEAAANEVVAEIKAGGGEAVAVQADMGDPAAIDALFAAAAEAFPDVPLTVVVNNAGITKDTLMMRMKTQQWQDVIDINLSAVFHMSKAAFKVMSKQRYGRIINMASVVGQFGNAGQANYAAAKGGVLGLTMANAKEFSGRGITVNAVAPGFIATDMVEHVKGVDELTKMIPISRLGEASEVAGMVRFLAVDPAGDYITGHTFNVDGGMAIGC